MPRVAVVLSGCGFLDGAEIHEAVCTLLALDQYGADVLCCAPDIPQADVINHVAQAPLVGESRNVLVESARIARGQIRDLAEVSADEIDAVIFPGGFGAAKNLCTFASEGAECQVNPEVTRLVHQMVNAKKPIGAICIAPAMIARVLARAGVKATLTIGKDKDTAAAVEAAGAQHRPCAADDIVVDEPNKLVTTPAYMLAGGPAEVFAGVSKLVNRVLEFCAG
jgi:enhancing lycopene biosynthesis protein 2